MLKNSPTAIADYLGNHSGPNFKKSFYLWCLWGGTYIMVYVWRPEDYLWKLVLAFNPAGLGIELRPPGLTADRPPTH